MTLPIRLVRGTHHVQRERELAAKHGVYRDVFEQSLLLEPANKRTWNFFVSLGAQVFVVSLVLLVPLLFRDRLPAVHWKDIVLSAPVAPRPLQPQPDHASNNATQTPSLPHRRIFQLVTTTTSHPAPSSGDFVPEAPPSLGIDSAVPPLAGNTNMLGRFIRNEVATPPSKPVEVPQPPSKPIPVGGDVQMAKLLRKVMPLYPPLARSARISGVVHLIGIIAKDGTIQHLQLVSGHPLLARAALEAVQQWVYKPTLLNGMPVEVIAPIEVSFTLGP